MAAVLLTRDSAKPSAIESERIRGLRRPVFHCSFYADLAQITESFAVRSVLRSKASMRRSANTRSSISHSWSGSSGRDFANTSVLLSQAARVGL